MSEARAVFWGAGKYAETVFGALCKEYAPVAYGDNNPAKHGTSFMDLPVLPLEQIEALHPGCRYYLTVDVQSKPYLMESLLARGIDRSRIINLEEYKKYKSCWQIETCMYYDSRPELRCLKFCCSDFGKNRSPESEICGDAHDKTVHNFYAMRDSTIEELNLPAGDTSKSPCSGCKNVVDGLWCVKKRIRLLSFVPRSLCNFKCSYCVSPLGPIDDSFTADVEESLEYLRFMKKNNIIDTETLIHLAAGEITVHPLRDKILAELQDNPCWIFTNAGVYNIKIGEMLSMGKTRLYPSIDAGTRETFKKIKGVDLFDKVCENLGKYSADGFVHLKYIVLPGVNDSDADIEGFVDLCGRLKIRAVDIVRDLHNLNAFGPHTLNAVVRMLNELQRLGVDTSGSNYALSAIPSDWMLIEKKLGEIKNA
jgi:pyruvate-formate lyase-activating enzyme